MTTPPTLSRLAAMKRGTAAIKSVPYPGREPGEEPVMVGIKPLSAAALQDAGLQAALVAERWPEHSALRRFACDGYDRELTYQLLHRCLVDPEHPEQPFAASVQELRELMSFAEAEALAEAAMTHQEFASPDLNALSAEGELEEVVEGLGKGGPFATRSPSPSRTETPSAFSGGPQRSSPTDSSSGSTSDESSATGTRSGHGG